MTDSELWSFQRKKIDEINSILLSLIDKTNITAELKKTIIKYKEISSEQKLKNIPVVLSKSLSIFLGVPNGTKMSEKIVMNKIIKYINEHNLCSEDESSDVITLLLPLKDQQITLDEKLIKLININSRSYIMNRITPVHTSNNCFKLKIPYSQIQRCIKNKFIDMRRQNPVKVYCKTNKIDEELERYSLMWGVSPDHIKKRAIKNYSTFLNSNVSWKRVVNSSMGIEGWYEYAPKKYQKKTIFCTILLSGENEIKKLNKKYRKKNKTTDVLSFPFYNKKELQKKLKKEKEIYLGDIIINLNKIKSKKNKNIFKIEFNKLWIHGLTHLFGYDHCKDQDFYQMNKIEKKFLSYLN